MKRHIKHTGVAVVEGRWDDNRNTSVRGLFDLLSDLNCGTPHGYHYETFCDYSALRNVVIRMADDERMRVIYVAAHGNERGIYATGDAPITAWQFAKMFSDLPKGCVDGLFLGSCLFADAGNVGKLLNPADSSHKPPFQWVAGYSESVDWIQSSMLDLLFFHELATFDHLPAAKQPPPGERIRKVAQAVGRLAPGLVKDLGFQIYVRHRKTCRPLLDATGAALDLALEGE